MKPIHIVTAVATPKAIAEVGQHNPKTAELMAVPFDMRYRTKRSADKLQAELEAAGIWIVTRKVIA